MFADVDLDGALDLVVANGHIDETVRNIRGNVGYAQPPHLFLNQGNGTFRDVARRSRRRLRAAEGRTRARVRRLRSRRRRRPADDDQQRPGVPAFATISSPATAACGSAWSARSRIATRIGATVRIFHGGTSQSRMVKSGSSYLSQSELPVTFGVGRRDRVDRVVVTWPNGRVEEAKTVATGRAYEWVEGESLRP